jgi:flagellar biosynthesis/type III secretory pathway protein FliH
MASRIIKAGDGTGEVPVVPSPVFDAKVEAERILRQAQVEADRIRAQAGVEGRERGMAAVTELLVGARAAASRARAASAGELKQLAVRIAEKILGRELALRPEAVVDIVAEALTASGASLQVTLRCHPDDLAALERGRPRLLERCARAQAVHFRSDGQIGRGGCIVETELATIDARLTTQLDAIERALRGDEA